MSKISFEQFVKMMEYDVASNYACIEAEFCIGDDDTYGSCWLGKTIDQDNGKAVFWYGFVSDGSQAYDFETMDEFLNATIFDGKSIQELWDMVTLYNIDGCDVKERVMFYLNLADGSHRSPAIPLKGCTISRAGITVRHLKDF